MDISNLSPQQLRKAADLKERMAALQQELDQLGGTAAPAKAAGAGGQKKRRISAKGRAAISAAAKARWARARGGKPAAKPAPKRKVSAAGRKRLSELAKARWAKAKAAGRGRL